MHKRLYVFLEKKQIYRNFKFGFKHALSSIVESVQFHLDKKNSMLEFSLT